MGNKVSRSIGFGAKIFIVVMWVDCRAAALISLELFCLEA
jgi:hypothetical protein